MHKNIIFLMLAVFVSITLIGCSESIEAYQPLAKVKAENTSVKGEK